MDNLLANHQDDLWIGFLLDVAETAHMIGISTTASEVRAM